MIGHSEVFISAQQLEMESNGKRVDKNGNNIDYQTNPIVWGGYGSGIAALFLPANFQGTKDMNLYFLASRENEKKLNTAQYQGQTDSLSEGTKPMSHHTNR